jgi:hypothetical protein
MTKPQTAANVMFTAIAASTRAGPAMRSPPAEIPHAVSSRSPITNQQSQIENPLHLLQSPKLDTFITDFPEKDAKEVDRVHINTTQSFGISQSQITNRKSKILMAPPTSGTTRKSSSPCARRSGS